MAKVDEIKFWQGTQEQYDHSTDASFYNWQSNHNWEKANLSLSTNWYSSQYAFGKYFVFPGYATQSNAYMYSEDGLNWTQGTLPLNSTASRNQSLYANGKLMVSIHNTDKLEYTTDGSNWYTVDMPSSNKIGYWGLAYGNGVYIATSTDGYEGTITYPKIAYSRDGLSWTLVQNLPSVDTGAQDPRYVSWRAACYGDGKFVVMPCNTTKGFYSTDGINWNDFDIPNDWSTFWNFYNVAYGNGIFVAMSNNKSKYATSTDGIHWTAREFGYTDRHDIYFDGKKFIAVPDGGVDVITSIDGINWTVESEKLTESQYYETIVYGNGKYITVGAGSTVVQTKIADALCFTDTDTPTTSSKVYSEPFVKSPLTITSVEKGLGDLISSTRPNSLNIRASTYGNGKFVAVAWNETNKYVYSTDGINWTQGTLPSSQYWYSIAYGNGRFVTVAGAGANAFAYSSDGINWTQEAFFNSSNKQCIIYGKDLFLVFEATGRRYFYSRDGMGWFSSNLPAEFSYPKAFYTNGKFVVVDYYGQTYAYSTDGINWTQGTLPITLSGGSQTPSVIGNDSMFIILFSYTDKYLYSTDGINWVQGTLPSSQQWTSIAYGNGTFITCSNDSNYFYYVYSTDGINWTRRLLPNAGYWGQVVFGNDGFVIFKSGSSNNLVFIPLLNSITLSDTNSYNRNQAGDEEIQTNVGQDHPDYVCYINEVGIKIADKFIAVKHPDKSITLELTPGDTSYGWQTTTITNPTSYTMVESTNKGSDSTYSVMKVRFNGYTSLTCYINSYAESSYDYTVISKLDATSYPTADSSDTAYANTKSKQYDPSTFPGNWTTVTFNNIDGEEHFFYVVYRKDGSASSYNDRGYFIIDEGQ